MFVTLTFCYIVGNREKIQKHPHQHTHSEPTNCMYYSISCSLTILFFGKLHM